ncbi:hypothetical protein ABPG73_018250 [Tetrahymena malaccensis]
MIPHFILLLNILLLSHFINGIDPNCIIISPNNGQCIQCKANFQLDQSQGLCIPDCDENLFLDLDSQKCVPSCKYNQYGFPDQGVCQQIYECPMLVDLGQDFHSGLASQIIVDDKNQIIISISNTDTNIKLWNQVNGILKMNFSGHTSPVLKIYLLLESNQLLSFSSKGEIFFWDYSTGILNQSQIVKLGQLTSLSCVNLNFSLITLYGYQGEFYAYNLQTQKYKKYVGHFNIVLNSIIINPSSFITYSLDKQVILWSDSTSTYGFQKICVHDSIPNGFTLLNFSSNFGQESYLFSFGSSGSDSLNLQISNLKLSSIQCQGYLKGDFTQPIRSMIGDSSSQSVIVYSSAEVVIYGFNSDTRNFILLQKISEQFLSQLLFLPLQGLQIFENSIIMYTQFGKLTMTSYINNNNTIQSEQIIQTTNFITFQINIQNIQGALIDHQKSQLYIFGQQIHQINLISQSVNYIISNLPIPYIRHTQSVPQVVYDSSQNVLVSTSKDGLSLSYDFLTSEIISIFQHPDYKNSLIQPQGQVVCLVQGLIACVAYSDLSFICYHAINMIVHFKQIFFQPILRLFNDDINGYVLINSLDYLQIIDPFNSKIIKTINKAGQFYYVQLTENICGTVTQGGYNDRVHKQSIVNALIIEDIQVIISYNYDTSNNLQAWNFNTDQSQSLVGHTKGINGVQFMLQQNIIISYDKAGQVIVWSYNIDLSKIMILQRLSQNQNNEITNLFLFTKFTNLFISLDITGNVFMTNILNGNIAKAFKVQNMNAMIIDEQFDRIFLYGSRIEVYSAITGVKVQEIIGFDNQVQQIIFKDNYIIAYGSLVIQSIARDTLVLLYQSQFQKNIYSLTVLMNFVGMVGNNVDSTIEVWDYTSGVMISEIKNKSYPQNLVSIFSDEQSQLFIVQNVDRYLFTVTPNFNSFVQQKDQLFAKMTSSYIKNYVFDFYSNILIVCNDDTIIAWQYYSYVGFQGQAVMVPSESLIMSAYHAQQDVITYADLNQNIWQVSQNLLYYKLQLHYQPKQIVLHTNTYILTDGIYLYSYDLNFKLAYQLQIYPFSIYIDDTISYIFVQTYSYQIIQILLNTSNSQLTIVNVYQNHKSRIINCIINTIYSHIITFDVTGYLAINNYSTLKPIIVSQYNSQIIRDIQIDFTFKRLITCSQDQSSILFTYDHDAPLKVINIFKYSSSVVQAVIDTVRLQVLIWTDLQLAIQVRDLNSTNLDLIKQIYGPGDYKTQIKLNEKSNILAIFNQFQVNLHDRNANDAIINSLRMPSQIYNITHLQFISDSLFLIRSKSQLNLVQFSNTSITIQKSFSMLFPTLLSLSYINQQVINIKGINLLKVFNYTFPYSSDSEQNNYSVCYSNLQRTSSYFQLSQDLTAQSVSFQKISQSINSIVLNIQMDDEQPFFFIQKQINFSNSKNQQQIYVYDKKQQSQKDRVDLLISSFEQFNMPTLTIKNFNWKIKNQTTYKFNKNTQNIIFVNSTFQDNIFGSQFFINSTNSLMIDNMQIQDLNINKKGQTTQLRALQISKSLNFSLFQIANTNMVYIKSLSLKNLVIENSVSLFQISSVKQIIIQNLFVQNVTYQSQNEQENIWSTLFLIQNSQNIQINSIFISNCKVNAQQNNFVFDTLDFSQLIIFQMKANKNLSSRNLAAQYNNKVIIYDISQTYLDEDQGYIQVVNDTISIQEMIIRQCESVIGQALNKIQTSYFELNQSLFTNNTCLNSYGCAFDIIETKFKFIKCVFLYLKSQYGGAISIRKSPYNNLIQESNFQFNVASQGGSIYLQESNFEIIGTVISQNTAEVGGAIRYIGYVPDFIIKKQYVINSLSQNNIIKNQAKIFGQNIGSYPRFIEIESIHQEVDFNFIQQTQDQIEYKIDQFMSGGNLNFNLKIFDEENGIVNLDSLEQSSQELQNEFQQYQLECISLNPQSIQINGNKAIYNSAEISFKFQSIQLISNPLSSSVFYIKNNMIQIPNPQNLTQFQSKPLYIKINVKFRQCEMGEIIIQSTQNTPSYCQLCPAQKYSLYMNKEKYQCIPCGDSQSQVFIYLSSVIVGCLYILFCVRATRQMILIKVYSYYIRMIGLASIGNSEQTDKSDIYLKFYMHFIQTSSIAFQISQPQFLKVIYVGVGSPINFLKFSVDCRNVFTEEFLPHAYGRIIWSQILSLSYFLFLVSIYYILYLVNNFYNQQIQYKNTICTFVLFCYLMLSISNAPYININFNRTDQFLCITLIICLQLNLLVSKSEDDTQFQICSFLLYGFYYLFSSFLIIQVLLVKIKKLIFFIGEKYPSIKSNFRYIFERLGIKSKNKMKTFKNWTKVFKLLSCYLHERNNKQIQENSKAIKNEYKYFCKQQVKNQSNTSPIIQTGSETLNLLSPTSQPTRKVINLRLIQQNVDEKQKDDSQYTLSITDQEPSVSYLNKINTFHPKQEDSAQKIFSQRIRKKNFRNNEINSIYFFKVNKNKPLFNLDTQEEANNEKQ